MRKISLIICAVMLSVGMYAQKNSNIIVQQKGDSAIDQHITLERDFQPVIQDAGKINSVPKIYEPAQKSKADVQYTNFSRMLSSESRVNQLTFANSRFSTSPSAYRGFLRAAIGFPMSALNFYYKMNEMDKVTFDVHFDHLGQWDRFTPNGAGILAKTGGGFNVDVMLGNSALNIGFDAYNLASKRYYKGSYWDFDAHVGLHSTASSALLYKLQIGYKGLTAKNTNFDTIPMLIDINPSITDNQLLTIGQVGWSNDLHQAGLNARIQDHFYSTADSLLNPKNYHSMHFEPFYAYTGNRFDIHLGVNLDLSLNRGRTFAASPNITFEGRVVPEWLAIYGGAVGEYDTHTLSDDLQRNHYMNMIAAVRDSVNSYRVADAFLGIKLRPHHDLLFKLYAHYIYTIDDHYYVADSASYQFTNIYANSGEWKIGGAMHYHYRDIATLSIDGFYRMHTVAKDSLAAYDRPSWQVQVDLRVKLDKKKQWTLFSENYLIGKRLACVQTSSLAPLTEATLKPIIDLNLGVEYAIDKNFAVYFRLNDYIHWGKFKNSQWYDYTTQGGNVLAGISWTF